MIAVVSVACCKEGGDTQATLPGLEKDANGNYISYRGYPMPSWEPSYEGMVELLDLVATQKGEIDDNLFVEFMTTNVVKANEIYFLNKYRSGYYEWYNVDHWGGNGVHYNIKLDSDGTLYSHEIADAPYPEIEEYYAENGYEGYYPMLSVYSEGGYEFNTARYVAGVAEALIEASTEIVNAL